MKKTAIVFSVLALLWVGPMIGSRAAERTFSVAVNCSEEVSEVPELYFTDTAYQSFAVPLSGTVAFAGAGAYTNQRQQQLHLAATDDQTEMATAGLFRISVDNTSWSAPQPMTGTIGLTLDAGDGSERVYVEYIDAAGNVALRPAVAEIMLDQTDPTAAVDTGS